MKQSVIVALVAAAIGAGAALLAGAEPAQAQGGQAVPDGTGGVMIVGTAGDLQNVHNLIYIVHKRKPTEREEAFLKGMDSKFPEHRITLSVYRMNNNGSGPDRKLVYMRDITWDEMALASDQITADEIQKMRDEVNRLAKRK
jgi:hypothetical protein